MCDTCIYRTDDKDFLKLPRGKNPCHEDDLPNGNPNGKLCAGSQGEKGSYVGNPMFSDWWNNQENKINGTSKSIMDASRLGYKKRYCV